ncbi:hypothetical protein ACP70R_010464 [Stipagrostis hirtigluma subsp. patula]
MAKKKNLASPPNSAVTPITEAKTASKAGDRSRSPSGIASVRAYHILKIILVLAEKHHCRGLKKTCFDFLNSWTAPFADIDMKGFEYLAQSCPTLMKYLIDVAVARGLEEAKISEGIRKAINHIDRCGDSPSVISDS